MAQRTKYCAVCNKDASIMYRIQYLNNKDWVFACKTCVVSVKKDNPDYKYGGTWKR